MRQLSIMHTKLGEHAGTIEVYEGDLTDLGAAGGVDMLVVSAFPNDYIPSPTSLMIGALARRGISVKDLANHKAVDLRQYNGCWVSDDLGLLGEQVGAHQILCFEPGTRGRAPEVVGDLFRGLVPFIDSRPQTTSVAMPLVACGDQATPVTAMLTPLLDAAVNWMRTGLPLKRLLIVERLPERAVEIARAFERLKGTFGAPQQREKGKRGHHDAFLSYSHRDSSIADFLSVELRRRQPTLDIFMDQRGLKIGCAWQQQIYEAVAKSHRMIALITPAYLESKDCQEELFMGLRRRKDEDDDYVFPIYVQSASLPNYVTMMQYLDARERNEQKLTGACDQFLQQSLSQSDSLGT